ncbi:MAG: bifunctional diaminohydroxyphosphoribosylaminopyrimidine deaminase/5-amino-6-(5-phosphoribosylamino)uracil reductase RibD [Hydrogenophaga sp.]|uniref:bifunctional diaminohydroxyphosphoribosylaminopyrimidine deaminase/5-amino-6-(5-phosphoribosylamino)uracil reductase RibD n=1 Tax=Hydrogenophaga sp. TaxID=1904254 RepID=UPI003D1229A4
MAPALTANGAMARALDLARLSLRLSNPNPRVGCVLVGADGRVIGEGHTQQAGGPHAEVMALRDAQARGETTQGATAFVTLEPCSHHGRTPPCCEALMAARVGQVVVAIADPNPLVAGQGVQRLRSAGIGVELLADDDPAAVASRELNIGFFSRMTRGQPWVRMKMASSLDGTTALENGASQWITGEAARTDGHAWRARACAVLTGVGTVLEDNPRLDVRLVDTPRQPHLIVVDSRLKTPPSARLFAPPGNGQRRQIWIYHASQDATAIGALEAQGATLLAMPGAHGKVELADMLRDLGRREVNELHLEAGSKLNGSFLREGLVDEVLIYLAPCLLGHGARMADFGPLQHLQEATRLEMTDTRMLDGDLRVLARVPGGLPQPPAPTRGPDAPRPKE